MATGCVFSPLPLFLLLIGWPLVTSRVLPSTSAPVFSSTNTSSQQPPLRASQAAAPHKRAACSVVNVYPVRDDLQKLLLSGSKLIELELSLPGYPPDFLAHHWPDNLNPSLWIRTSGRDGRRLLVLEDNYKFLSLNLLGIGVHRLNVTLEDRPRYCLRRMREAQLLAVFREALLNDFKPPTHDHQDNSLSRDEHVCNSKFTVRHGVAHFLYTCCHKSPDDDIICSDVVDDTWINLLEVFIFVLKIGVILFSPAFIPSSFYLPEHDSTQYIYHSHNASRMDDDRRGRLKIRLKVINSEKTEVEDGKKKKVVGLLKNMEHFKKQIKKCSPGKVYELSVDQYSLLVKPRRLLDENTVPVGFFTVLYNKFILCQIRKKPPLEQCCQAKAFRTVRLTWYRCSRVFARIVLLGLLVAPSVFRLWAYLVFERKEILRKMAMAQKFDVKMDLFGNMLLLLPLHVLFVATYILVLVDYLVYELVTVEMKERFKLVLLNSLRGMRQEPRSTLWRKVMAFVTQPCKDSGVLGLPLFFLKMGALLILLPFLLLYLPALSLTVRILFHLTFLVCPEKLKDLNGCAWWKSFGKQLDKENLMIDKKVWMHLVSMLSIPMCLVTLWFLMVLFTETVTFFLEIAVYTLMGVIVNAEVTLQYAIVLVSIVMYGRTIFRDLNTRYLTYHKKIQAEVVKMKRSQVKHIASQDSAVQANTAFHVEGYEELLMAKRELLMEKLPYTTLIDMIKDQVTKLTRFDAFYCETAFFDEPGYRELLENMRCQIHQMMNLNDPEGKLQKVVEREQIHSQADAELRKELQQLLDESFPEGPGGDCDQDVQTLRGLLKRLRDILQRNDGQGHTSDQDPNIKLVVSKGKLKWEVQGVLVFLDKKDTPYTPQKFFYQTIKFNYPSAPGNLDVNILKSLWSFFCILIFLVFVFIIVMAFGDAYQVSSTNRLLATVAGGLVPLLFRIVLARASLDAGVDVESVQFQTELQNVIENFTQHWPVYDIVGPLEEVPDSVSSRGNNGNPHDNPQDSPDAATDSDPFVPEMRISAAASSVNDSDNQSGCCDEATDSVSFKDLLLSCCESSYEKEEVGEGSAVPSSSCSNSNLQAVEEADDIDVIIDVKDIDLESEASQIDHESQIDKKAQIDNKSQIDHESHIQLHAHR